MDADLASYLDKAVPSLQEGAEHFVDCDRVKKNICTVARESRAVVADLMVDQPLFLLSSAFVSGLLLGRTLFSGKKPS